MQADDLKRLAVQYASAEFQKETDLRKAEGLVLEAAASGHMAKCYELNSAGNNPAAADHWGQDRQLRAKFIVWLCTNQEVRKHIHPFGIQISGADVTGDLDLSFVSIPFPITLQHCRVRQPVKLVDVELPQLDLSGSYSTSIVGEGLVVKHDALFKDGFTCDGQVNLFHAQIGGTLDFTGGKFTNPFKKDIPGGGIALQLSELTVNGTVHLENVEVSGASRLLYSHIDGYLDCSGGHFTVPLTQQHLPEMSAALSAERAYVKGGIFLRDGFTAVGDVDLSGAETGGTFFCEGANFKYASLDLRNMSALTLFDSGWNDLNEDNPTVWPEPDHLELDGFTYSRISSRGQINVAKRLKWLELQQQPPFFSQPYLHLAKVLGDSGYSDGRLAVLVRMEYLRRKYQDTALERPASLAYGMLVGYGYHPLWAIAEIVGLGALGWIIYRRSYLANGIVPTDKEACEAFREDDPHIPRSYPSFSPLMYSIENSLPLVKLGQAEHWQPDPEPNRPQGTKRVVRLGYRGVWPPYKVSALPRSAVSGVALVPLNISQVPLDFPGEERPAEAPACSENGAAIDAKPVGGRREFLQNIKRLLVFTGLETPDDTESVPSVISSFGTSPRFVSWFRWFQILLGWLLATLFVAGVSGIVHKE